MAPTTITSPNERRSSSPARRSSQPTTVDAAFVDLERHAHEPGVSVTSHTPRAMTTLARLGLTAAAHRRPLRGVRSLLTRRLEARPPTTGVPRIRYA